MIAGQFVEEDVTVSVPTYTLLRDPDTFDSPECFIPERWLTCDEAQKAKMMKVHLPFLAPVLGHALGGILRILSSFLLYRHLSKGLTLSFSRRILNCKLWNDLTQTQKSSL
jgi:hypothetical protein